jgi:hypothetical protein
MGHGILEDQGHVMTRLREEVSTRMPRPEETRLLRLLGVLVLGETITGTTLAGIALVLAGVALTRRRTKPPDSERRVE